MEARSSLQSKQKLPIFLYMVGGHAGSEVLAQAKVGSTSKAGKNPGPLLSLFCRKRRLHFSLDSGNRAFQKASPEGGEEERMGAPLRRV